MKNNLPEFLNPEDMAIALKRLNHFLDEEGYSWSTRLSLLLTSMCIDVLDNTEMPPDLLADLVKWSMKELQTMDEKYFK